MAAADHYAENDEEKPCGAGGVHRCFWGLLRSATSAAKRARSVAESQRQQGSLMQKPYHKSTQNWTLMLETIH